MIEYTVNGSGELQLVQRDIPPSVYLDHWAWRRFSENDALGKRLTTALQSLNGTLTLSCLNLVEFSKVTDETQARAAERLLEANLPRVFFMEIDPFSVIRREDELLAGAKPAPPHADVDFLVAFSQVKPTSLNLFTTCDLFRIVQTSQLDGGHDDLADTVVKRVEALRGQLDTDAEFQSALRRLPSGTPVQRGTRFLLRELLRTLIVDKGTKINQTMR